MRRAHTDHQPGPLPDIRPSGTSVLFEFDGSSGDHGAHLVIRCDDDGEVFASIAQPSAEPDRPETGTG